MTIEDRLVELLQGFEAEARRFYETNHGTEGHSQNYDANISNPSRTTGDKEVNVIRPIIEVSRPLTLTEMRKYCANV